MPFENGYKTQQIAVNDRSLISQKRHDCECTCPNRADPPEVPNEIPFAPVEQNVPALEQWLRDYYASSASAQNAWAPTKNIYERWCWP